MSHTIITTYSDLRKIARSFASAGTNAERQIHSLVIWGGPGTGKSETFCQALEGEYFQLIKARLSAFDLYQKIVRYKDAMFLFDDTREILRDRECVNLLMQLGEHKLPKKVQWNTSSLGEEAQKVETNSRLCLILNDMDEYNKTLAPIFSRSLMFEFAPTKTETHNYVDTWFAKCKASREIHKFVGNHLEEAPAIECRDYGNALQMYDTLDWREYLITKWSIDKRRLEVMKIMADKKLVTFQAKVEAAAAIGIPRNTFATIRRKLQKLA